MIMIIQNRITYNAIGARLLPVTFSSSHCISSIGCGAGISAEQGGRNALSLAARTARKLPLVTTAARMGAEEDRISIRRGHYADDEKARGRRRDEMIQREGERLIQYSRRRMNAEAEDY